MAQQGLRPKLNPQAIDAYLTLGYVPAPQTAFDGIEQVMPGHVRRMDMRGQRQWRWWNLAEQTPTPLPQGQWNEQFLHLLDDATRIRMRSEVPFGAFLSGGVDSSTVVGLMARHSSQPIKTFCIGFTDPRFDESPHALAAAQRFGSQHSVETVKLGMLERWQQCLYHCDQPHGDASFMPTLRVSELAARHVKVVLTGDGGDELFGGYEKYASFFANPAVHALDDDAFQRAYLQSVSLFLPEEKARLYSASFARATAGNDVFAQSIKPWFDQVPQQDRLNQVLYFDTQSLLCGNNLVKPDRMGMAVSIENRAPFLDHRVVEFAFGTPGEHKLFEGDLKHRYKQAVVPLIGEHLALRKKQMFTVPIGEWFRGERYGWLAATLRTSGLLAQMFDPIEVERLLQTHRTGDANHTRELRALAALALWADRFEVELG
jgi:asparagine synthase (glutamine-hydrolysing)